jgi:mannose-1-phosphate guanylyltransferase
MANPHYYGLILAGGRGTRFWPRSRKRYAKQVLNVFGERSLIQGTVDRLAPVIAPATPEPKLVMLPALL